MDRAASLIFPGSRTLAGWWRQLQPYQPQALHVGYAFVHRIEAPVQVIRSQSIDACTQLILQALTLPSANAVTTAADDALERLQRRLHLPRAVLQQLLRGLELNQLLVRASSQAWQATELGLLALRTNHYPIQAQERREFAFVEHLDPNGRRLGPPRFLPLAEAVAVPWNVEDALKFESACLQETIAHTDEWKLQVGFPREVEALVQSPSLPAWQQVLVDRPSRILLVLILSRLQEEPTWLGFAVKADGWELSAKTPIVRVPCAALQDYVDSPDDNVWQEAWRSWGQQRQLPVPEVENCSLRHHPPRLDLIAPERLVQRFRAMKSDLLNGEAWLLAGNGYLRTAALLTLTAT